MTAAVGPAIAIDRLTRIFGSTRAVDDLSLEVPRGSVFGFLGPNGAGKSTTLGILTGLDRPTSGTARILGYDVLLERDQLHPLIGSLPDVPSFYPWMTARQFLELSGRLFRIPPKDLQERIDTVLDLAGLTGVDRPAGGFSRGMRQRLGIAQALINAPQVLLLDEPTSALDPVGRKDVLDIIAALRGRTTVFFSSHILSDVERVCDQVAILDKGRVVLESSIDTIHSRTQSRRLRIQFGSAPEAGVIAAAVAGEPWIDEIAQEADILEIVSKDLELAQRMLPAIIGQHRVVLRRFETAEPTLEDVFVDLVTAEA